MGRKAYMAAQATVGSRGPREAGRSLLTRPANAFRRWTSIGLVHRGPDSALALAGVVFVAGALVATSSEFAGDLVPDYVLLGLGASLLAIWVGTLNSKHTNHRRRMTTVGLAKDLESADLSGMNLRGVNLRGKSLKGTKLSNANLSSAQLAGCDMDDVRLTETILAGADLRCASLRFAGLYRADLRRATLQGADLSDATLEGADLWQASAWSATLRGANLRGADLRFCDLRHADLRGAKLDGADLRGADLRSATYYGSELAAARRTEGIRIEAVADPPEINLTR